MYLKFTCYYFIIDSNKVINKIFPQQTALTIWPTVILRVENLTKC